MSRNAQLPDPKPIEASRATPEVRPVVTIGIASAVLTGILRTTQDVLESRTPGIDMGFGWSALHTSWLAAMFVAFLGLTALQRPQLDRFGRFATRFALLGTGAMTVMAAYETVLWGATNTSHDDPPPLVLGVILVVIATYVLGLVLFSVATIRARVLPRAAAAGLLAAVVIKMATGGVFGPLALLGIAVAGLGLSAVWVVRRERLRES